VLESSSWRRRGVGVYRRPGCAQCGLVDGIVGLTKIDEAGMIRSIEFRGVEELIGGAGENMLDVRGWWLPSGLRVCRE
jgi:hypothetical protein